MIIWVDNDGCPQAVKEVVFKASLRLKVKVIMVANRPMATPKSKWVESIVVPSGADVADQYIADHVKPLDVVITSDVPLADAVIDKKAVAINAKGETYTKANIKEKLSMRDFMTTMRNDGLAPPTAGREYSQKDRELFANALDRTLTMHLRTLSEKQSSS